MRLPLLQAHIKDRTSVFVMNTQTISSITEMLTLEGMIKKTETPTIVAGTTTTLIFFKVLKSPLKKCYSKLANFEKMMDLYSERTV
jgi:hypothetical protein